MIQIIKGNAPEELAKQNIALLNSMKMDFESNKNDYLNGIKKFTFTAAYRTEEVKITLITCQNNKCCFSEAKFVGDYSNVEHFRPKGRVDTWPDGGIEYPGYYWLAYDWSNLFLCKSRINSSDKRNFFPVTNNRNRTHYDTNIEKNLLIDVNLEDPRKHIKFINEEPYPVDERGLFNITFFQLRHSEFDEARRTKFNLLKALKDLIDIGISQGHNKAIYADQIKLLREAMSPKSEFSSMAIDFLSEWPHLE